MQAIPNFAIMTKQYYCKDSDGQSFSARVLEWHASKGYHTDFKQVKHYGFQVENTQGIYKTRKVTVSEKTANKIIEWWQKLSEKPIVA